MSIMLMYACAQVEMAVRDLNGARAFMQNVLGATKTEQSIADEVRSLFAPGTYDIDHLDCGEGLFQFNEPSPSLMFDGQKVAHQIDIDRMGPCVTNLNFFIDDEEHALQLLTSMGAKVRIEGPSGVSKSLGDYGPDNTRPGGKDRKFRFMGTRHLIGLDLEIMEPNFNYFIKQTAQQPCFVQPRVKNDGNLLLHRLRLVVPDLEDAFANIAKIFLPACRSNPYDYRTGSLARAFRIGFGGIELEYCQPLSKTGALAAQLEREGPGLVTVEFGARDANAIIERLRKAGTHKYKEQEDLLGLKGTPGPRRTEIGCRDPVGFDVVLEPRVEPLLAGNA